MCEFSLVCLSEAKLNKLSTKFVEIFGGVGCVTSNKHFNFGTDTDEDTEMFNSIFITTG